MSLGIEVYGILFDVVIPRNTPIPTKKDTTHVTVHDNQESVLTKVYQGERSRATDNHFLGNLHISGIPPAPKGVPKIKKWFEIDANGILTVTSELLGTGITKKLTVSSENGRLSKEEIEKMIKDAEKYKLEDQEFKKKVNAHNALENCLYDMKNKINDCNIKKRLQPESLKKIENAIADTTEWLKDNDTASVDDHENKQARLEFVCKPLF